MAFAGASMCDWGDKDDYYGEEQGATMFLLLANVFERDSSPVYVGRTQEEVHEWVMKNHQKHDTGSGAGFTLYAKVGDEWGQGFKWVCCYCNQHNGFGRI